MRDRRLLLLLLAVSACGKDEPHLPMVVPVSAPFRDPDFSPKSAVELQRDGVRLNRSLERRVAVLGARFAETRQRLGRSLSRVEASQLAGQCALFAQYYIPVPDREFAIGVLLTGATSTPKIAFVKSDKTFTIIELAGLMSSNNDTFACTAEDWSKPDAVFGRCKLLDILPTADWQPLFDTAQMERPFQIESQR